MSDLDVSYVTNENEDVNMIENVTKVPQYTLQSRKIDQWPEYNQILSEIFGKIVRQICQLKRR